MEEWLLMDSLETEPDTASALCQFQPEWVAGFFTNNTLLHHELPYRTWGVAATPVSYDLWHDNLVTIILLICMAMIVFAFNKIRVQLKQQTRDFMAQPRVHSGLFAVETSIETQSRMLLFVALSLMGAVAMLAYSHARFGVGNHLAAPHMLIGLYALSILSMFMIRGMLTRFVNWVFFPKSQQKLWNDSVSYLISVEALAFFPLLVVFVYSGLSVEKTIALVLIILLIIKFLLTFKTFRIFFPKSYCLFHLFAYLCALEIMPLLALWKLLAIVTETLVVKY